MFFSFSTMTFYSTLNNCNFLIFQLYKPCSVVFYTYGADQRTPPTQNFLVRVIGSKSAKFSPEMRVLFSDYRLRVRQLCGKRFSRFYYKGRLYSVARRLRLTELEMRKPQRFQKLLQLVKPLSFSFFLVFLFCFVYSTFYYFGAASRPASNLII